MKFWSDETLILMFTFQNILNSRLSYRLFWSGIQDINIVINFQLTVCGFGMSS
jgi:hypothetical protein